MVGPRGNITAVFLSRLPCELLSDHQESECANGRPVSGSSILSLLNPGLPPARTFWKEGGKRIPVRR